MFDALKSAFGQKQSKEDEAGTLRRIDEDAEVGVDGGEVAFGPQAILMVGFSQQELADTKDLLQSMEADMFKVIPCSKAMMQLSLQEALDMAGQPWEAPPLGTRRSIVLSGMYGGEVVDVVSAYRDSGLPPCVFAAAVPNNMGRRIQDLVTEIHAEDAAMRQAAAQRASQRGELGSGP